MRNTINIGVWFSISFAVVCRYFRYLLRFRYIISRTFDWMVWYHFHFKISFRFKISLHQNGSIARKNTPNSSSVWITFRRLHISWIKRRKNEVISVVIFNIVAQQKRDSTEASKAFVFWCYEWNYIVYIFSFSIIIIPPTPIDSVLFLASLFSTQQRRLAANTHKN